MGYDSFGLKIGIEGEREFKNALKEINQSFKVLGSEMNLVTSQFDKQDKSIQAITARNNVLNKEIEAQKEKISTHIISPCCLSFFMFFPLGKY
jgi:phage-related minor tail protein